MSSCYALRIAEVRPETDNAVCVAFEVPPELDETFRFVPGQYLTLRRTIDGREVRRSYSICSGTDDAALRIAIKKIQGGVFSNHANVDFHPGDVVEVEPPQGRFCPDLHPQHSRRYLCIAAGSGR